MNAIELIDVEKQYGEKEATTYALKNLNLTIKSGEIVVIIGPSGSGKSTLLNLSGVLDHVSKGTIRINEKNISDYDDAALTRLRRDLFGFVFQDYALLPNLTAYQNIELGAKLCNHPMDIDDLLETVELKEHRDKFPNQMSGGEQQRVSIARALVKKPEVLLCDEPTGSLDEETGKAILSVLQKINSEYKTTIVIVTHNNGITQIADRVVRLNSGKIVEITENKEKKSAYEIRWV